MWCRKCSEVLERSVVRILILGGQHTTGCIFSNTPLLYKRPMANRATRPPREYPITLIFLIPCPSFSSSSSVCSISSATRSPPVSTPSYVKLPALRFATKISSLSSGNRPRREVLTCFRCSGLPHSLEVVSVLYPGCLPQAHKVFWRTHEREHTGDWLSPKCELMRETCLRTWPYSFRPQWKGAVVICLECFPGLVR
jgi:hypothetical protein